MRHSIGAAMIALTVLACDEDQISTINPSPPSWRVDVTAEVTTETDPARTIALLQIRNDSNDEVFLEHRCGLGLEYRGDDGWERLMLPCEEIGPTPFGCFGP